MVKDFCDYVMSPCDGEGNERIRCNLCPQEKYAS